MVGKGKGQFVNSGVGIILAETTRVVEAANCAIDIQNIFKAENAGLPAERRMESRVGVNSGDVMPRATIRPMCSAFEDHKRPG